jgi:hypothetical protein
MNPKISFVIPFATNDGELDYWPKTDTPKIILSTIESIKNINNKLKFEKEIILVDNTNTFPKIKMPNLKIISGWQCLNLDELKTKSDFDKYKIDNFKNLTMWISMAFNLGIKEAKYDYIVLQHNDVLYHSDFFEEFLVLLNEYEYISVDSKKISLSSYVCNKDLVDKLLEYNIDIDTSSGGFLKTKKIGLADAYFFFTRKDFFDDYFVDWRWSDTNHGATIKCILNNKKFIHLGPYYDNPNFEVNAIERTYKFNDKKFLTHLKGGFSENKHSYSINNVTTAIYEDEVNLFMGKFFKL